MAFEIEWRTRRWLNSLAYFILAVWCALEWFGSSSSFILHPFGLIAYFSSVSLCLVLSVVLFVHSPRSRLLTEERIAAALLLVPLMWNLI